jgi:hypothetical protein
LFSIPEQNERIASTPNKPSSFPLFVVIFFYSLFMFKHSVSLHFTPALCSRRFSSIAWEHKNIYWRISERIYVHITAANNNKTFSFHSHYFILLIHSRFVCFFALIPKHSIRESLARATSVTNPFSLVLAFSWGLSFIIIISLYINGNQMRGKRKE